MILTLIHSISFTVGSEVTLATWNERLAKGSYQAKLPVVRSEPAVLRLQICAFTNLFILMLITLFDFVCMIDGSFFFKVTVRSTI